MLVLLATTLLGTGCGDDGGTGAAEPAGSSGGGPSRPVIEEPPGTEPEEVAPHVTDLLDGYGAVVQEILADPGVAGDPDDPRVTNWQDGFTEEAREGPVTVALTATPSLTLHPGEPEAPVVECEDGGTAYDPGGGDVQAQADRSGACAYAYDRRSGIDGGGGWRGTVRVTWSVSWEQTDSGGSDSGSFDPFSLDTEFMRPVQEVQGIVTEGEL